MKKKWFVLSLILLTAVNLSALGTLVLNRWCHHKISFPACSDAEPGHYMREQLGVTDEQAAKMQTFMATFHPKIEAISQQMKEKRLDLIKELMMESPDPIRIERILQQMDSLQATLQREVVNHLLLEKEIFTPEQQEKFFSILLEQFSVGMKQKQNNGNRQSKH